MPTFGRANPLVGTKSKPTNITGSGNKATSSRLGTWGGVKPKNPLAPRATRPTSSAAGSPASIAPIASFDSLESGERAKIKKSGIYKLAKGEEVRGKGRTESALSKPEKKSKSSKGSKGGKGKGKHIRSIRLEKTDNGKILAHHQFHPNDDGSTQPDETHALNNMDELHDHLDDHFSEPGQPEQPDDHFSEPGQPEQPEQMQGNNLPAPSGQMRQ